MTKPAWLAEVEALLPMILEVSEKCAEPFRGKCFEMLLGHALSHQVGKGQLSASATNGHEVQSVGSASGARLLSDILAAASIDTEELSHLIDLQTGDVLATDLGRDAAEAQRKVAVLISLRHLANEGTQKVPRDELARQCANLGIYDSGNFSTYMKRAKTADGRLVFVKDGDSWRVAAPGRGYLIDTLKQIARRE